MKWESEGLYVPISCQQCEDAPCINVCPVKAVSRDEKLDYVKVDYDVCIGCRACVTVCPFGAMSFDVVDRRVVKCDLCDGDPQCVRFCEIEALEYVDADRVSVFKKKDAAERFSVAQKEAAALQAQV
jgi:Fe-S-cluster-containing hydrogenase component 2